jgi:molybdopterin molybdotransferase
LPAGADAVVRFEETDELGEEHGADLAPARPAHVAIRLAATPGQNVRPAGEDLRAGETILPTGTRLRPAEIGLLAALGQARVAVHRRPQVAILATGDEVCPLGETPRPGQIRDSNGPMLAAFVAACGGEALSLGIARDARDDLESKLAAVVEADLLLTAGGVSAGDYDLVKHVLRERGRIELWQVRIRPGKPLAFGRIGERPLIGLPGNPVAAAVAFVQFARPAILTLLGRRDLDLPTVEARLLARLDNRGGRRHYVRVRVEPGPDGWEARPAGPQGAGALSSLARANGLMVIPDGTELAETGEVYQVQMLDWGLG